MPLPADVVGLWIPGHISYLGTELPESKSENIMSIILSYIYLLDVPLENLLADCLIFF